MTETKSALLVGASGLVGGHCLQFLLEESSYTRVSVLVRRPLSITHDKLVQHVVDFSELETLGEFLAADDVYFCLGTTIKKAGTQEAFRKVDFDYPIKIAALTQHCGVAQFLLVSSLGADPHSRIFYNRVKGEVEEAIRKISFTTINIFRPSLLLGERTEHRTGEKAGAFIMSGLKYALVGPLRKYRAIQAHDVAKAMVQVAQKNLKGVNIFDSKQIQEIADSVR
jgi:Predicted nucleoside-diphosphate-sugar epimerases